jgi:hypothetical protein
VGRGIRTPAAAGRAACFGSRTTEAPFLTVEGATQVRGLQFWYSRSRRWTIPAKVIAYPPTIQGSTNRCDLRRE